MPPINISVIVTCHHKESTLGEALDSVGQQTKKPKEVIIVHDGPCENVQSYDKTTSIMIRPGVGVSKARDIGFKNSTGELLLFLDGDDKLAPDYIERACITLSPKVDIAYSDYVMWYEHGAIDYGKENVLIGVDVNPKLMLQFNRPIVSSVMKRIVYETVGGFPNLPVFEDYAFWMKAMSLGFTFKHMNSLFYYRQSHGSRNRQDKELRLKIHNQISNKYRVQKGKLIEQ